MRVFQCIFQFFIILRVSNDINKKTFFDNNFNNSYFFQQKNIIKEILKYNL